MARNASKATQMPPKTRKLYTPSPVHGRVIARHMSGQSNRRIAREEGIDRETVSRILSQEEITELKARGRSRLLEMVPKAISVYEDALRSDDLHLAAATATKLLEGTGLLQKGGIEQTTPEQPDQEQRKIQFLGQMMKMILEKHRRYDLPLPPELARLEERLNADPLPTTEAPDLLDKI